MIKLIKAELKKIFHKKSLYIVSIIFILYCILTNVIYKDLENIEITVTNTHELQEINASLDLDNEENKLEYIANLTLIETEELKNKYKDEIQYYLIDNYLYDLIYELNEARYLTEDLTKLAEINTQINLYKEKIVAKDWVYFINLKIDNLKKNIELTTNTTTLKRLKTELALQEYRLEKEIPLNSTNYLHEALETISLNLTEYYNLEAKAHLTKEEDARFINLKELLLTNKYVLENEKDVYNPSTLYAVLTNFPAEFGIFILIYIIMFSGSIVSEEYNKGTIKYLLTKPYRRSTILTSKLLTILILIPLSIIFMLIVEVLIGGLILGFNTLDIPVLIYNHQLGSLEIYSIFKYVSLYLLCGLPLYIFLSIVSFAISTISKSTSAAITITFLFYLLSNVISNLYYNYSFWFFKYFISLHWDFSYLLHNNTALFKTSTSLIVFIIYIMTILCLTYVHFQKKDVKNI